MTDLSAHRARIGLMFAALAAVGALVFFAIAPPKDPLWSTSAFMNGQLALIVIWAALGLARWHVRWSCGVAAIYVLRECGLCITSTDARRAEVVAVRQFTLRRMFGWLAGAAMATFVWKHLAIGFVRASPNAATIAVLTEQFSQGAVLTAIDALALWAALGGRPLRWRQAWLLVWLLPVQTAVLRLADQAVLGRAQPWREALLGTFIYDVFYLAPLLGVLLLARAAGYRLTMPR